MIYVGFEIEIEDTNRQVPFCLDNIRKLIDKTTHITGWKSQFGILPYHRSFSYNEEGKWGVESDASILNGAEFVSPAEEKDDALHALEAFLSYVDGAKCCTLDSCGLHLNISADNKTVEGMDKSYFLSNINQGLLHAFWGQRLKGTNTYCVPIKKILAHTRPLSILDKDIQSVLLAGKYRYVNNRTSNSSNRLEIRVMGGRGYHRKIKEIKKTTNMFCDLLEKSYKKTQPKSKKRVISYVNRIQSKKRRSNSLWIPYRGQSFGTNAFFYLLDSIKPALEKRKCPKELDYMLERRFPMTDNAWEAYCSCLSGFLRSYIIDRGPSDLFTKEVTQRLNETYYYIFKHLDKNRHNIPIRVFNLFLNGHSYITDKHYAILTVPKREKAADTFWLCKHSEKLSDNAKMRFVENLSLSALRFIKKKRNSYYERCYK